MPDPAQWSTTLNLLALLGAAAVIGVAGTRMASLADRLADRTGLGEALTGTLFLGLVTALPGLAASITAALDGRPSLAIGNAIGGIAIQTCFLAVADLAHRKANLEHAAASIANMVQTAILVGLLLMVLLGLTGPSTTLLHVHPVTPLLLVAAGVGLYLTWRSRVEPMWRPAHTGATVRDIPDEAAQRENLPRLVLAFALVSTVVVVAGALVAQSSGELADRTGLSEAVAGALLAGIATSLPELVTTVAAVRRGALTLAVGDIVGGNFFDVLFVFVADLAYREGSLYHAPGVGGREQFMTGLTALLNVILLLGLLYRQREGPAKIGFESLLMLVVYAGGMVALSIWN